MRYAVTEPNAGSDARTLETHRRPRHGAGDWVINGEKWFVTGPDNTDFMVVQAMVVDGGDRLPTLFFVDYDGPASGCRPIPPTRTPSPTATRSSCSRTFAFRIRRGSGAIGAADELANEWFVERADPHRRALHGCDGAAAHARRRVGDEA